MRQQIATRLQLPLPTVVRILETLEKMAFVERCVSDGTWRLMLYARSLSDGYNDEAWARECAAPEIAKLVKEILWPVDLHTCHGEKMIMSMLPARSG